MKVDERSVKGSNWITNHPAYTTASTILGDFRYKRWPGRSRTHWRSTVKKDLQKMGLSWEETVAVGLDVCGQMHLLENRQNLVFKWYETIWYCNITKRFLAKKNNENDFVSRKESFVVLLFLTINMQVKFSHFHFVCHFCHNNNNKTVTHFYIVL